MALNPYTLTTVEAAKQFLHGRYESMRVDAITVMRSLDYSHVVTPEPDPGTATCRVGLGRVELIAYASQMYPDHEQFLFATYPTLGELADAVHALNKGWRVRLIAPSSQACTALTPAGPINVSEHERFFTSTAEDLLEKAINAASALAEDYMDRQILSRVRTETYTAGSSLLLKHYPVIDVNRIRKDTLSGLTIHVKHPGIRQARVKVTDSTVTIKAWKDGTKLIMTYHLSAYDTLDALRQAIEGDNWRVSYDTYTKEWPSTDLVEIPYRDIVANGAALPCWGLDADVKIVDEEHGIVKFTDTRSAPKKIQIEYTAGLEVVPAGLEAVVLELVARILDRLKRDTALRQEKIGDRSWTAKLNLIDADIASRLNLYADRVLDVDGD